MKVIVLVTLCVAVAAAIPIQSVEDELNAQQSALITTDPHLQTDNMAAADQDRPKRAIFIHKTYQPVYYQPIVIPKIRIRIRKLFTPIAVTKVVSPAVAVAAPAPVYAAQPPQPVVHAAPAVAVPAVASYSVAIPSISITKHVTPVAVAPVAPVAVAAAPVAVGVTKVVG